MSPGASETNGLSLPEAYKASLEQHIQSGGWRLVCRDEELCKHVEDILMAQSLIKRESSLGLSLDAFSVMEESLCSEATSRNGLKAVAKAFEVLELASLNLYLYPWRKEYKTIKTYSGMFIHQVKPALAMSQVESLFGRLGYRLSRGVAGEEELCLSATCLPPQDLLHLAYSFFLARCECSLLLSATVPRSSQSARVKWELNLVQERRKGHSLQVAVQNVKRSLGTSAYPDAREVGGGSAMDEDVDLYTVQGNGEPECTAYGGTPIQSTDFLQPAVKPASSPVPCGSEAPTCQKSQRCVSTMTYKLTSPSSPGVAVRQDLPRSVEEQAFPIKSNFDVSSPPPETCTCGLEAATKADWHCSQCKKFHSYSCPVFRSCMDMQHPISYSYNRDDCMPDTMQKDPQQAKMSPLSDKRASPTQSFTVREPPGFPERHACQTEGEKPVVTCHTCHRSHGYLCEEAEDCTKASHHLEYQLDTTRHMPYHSCCSSEKPSFVGETQNTSFACLSCRVFHSFSCPAGTHCKQAHDIKTLSGMCEFKGCRLTPEILCRHCCAQFCRECWYKSPLTCLCGQPYDISSPV